MENTIAIKLIKEVKADLSSGIDVESTIEKLSKIREFAKMEQQPAVVKNIRLVCEHLEENGDFLIPTPEDEEIEDAESEMEQVKHKESLIYLLSLYLDLTNKYNMSDIRWYNKQLQESL